MEKDLPASMPWTDWACPSSGSQRCCCLPVKKKIKVLKTSFKNQSQINYFIKLHKVRSKRKPTKLQKKQNLRLQKRLKLGLLASYKRFVKTQIRLANPGFLSILKV